MRCGDRAGRLPCAVSTRRTEHPSPTCLSENDVRLVFHLGQKPSRRVQAENGLPSAATSVSLSGDRTGRKPPVRRPARRQQVGRSGADSRPGHRRPAASPVLIKIEPRLSVGVVDEGCDVEIGRRVIPPPGSQLTAPAPEISGDEARESARTALLAAAATALCGSRPAASTPSRGAITSRGRPHSAAA